MAQTFFDQMGDMNAMQMLMGLMPGFGANKGPMGAAPMTFDTDPQGSIDRARAGVTKQPGMQPPPAGGDPIAAMLPVTGAGNGFGPNAAHDLDVANEVQGMGAGNPLKNIDRANGSLTMPPMLPGMPPTIPPGGQGMPPPVGAMGADASRMPPTDPRMMPPTAPGFDAVPPAYTGPNNMDPDALPPPYTQPPTGRPQGPLLPPPGPPAAPNVAGLDPLTAAGIPGGPTSGPFNQGGSPGGPTGQPGLPPGMDPFKVAPPMLGPGAPTTTAMPPPDLQFPPGGAAPPAAAGLPPAAAPTTLGTPPAPRAGALPPGMGPDGRPTPGPLVRGLQSALGLDSRAGMAGFGKGLVAGAGTNPGSKLGAVMRGAGAAMGGRGDQEDKDRKANLEDRKQDETELHSRWQEQQGNAKTFMENFMLPLKAEDMVAGTRLKNARSGSLDDGGTGTGGKNAPWKSTPFGKVVTIDDQVQKSFAEDMKTLREQGRINGWTDKQFEAGSTKAKQDAEKLRQSLYGKHNITPGQANIERTRGASQKNPVDPFSLGLSHEQFDKMVPPAKFNPDTNNWDGGWFIPKPGANPIQRFKPQSSSEDTQRKRQNEYDADRTINAGSPAGDYSEAA